MSKTTKQAAAFELDAGTAPTVIAKNAHAIDVVSPDRRRPVLAINDNGELTVCCRRTARKHGWKVEGAMFERTRSGKRAEAAAKGKKLAVDLDTGALVAKTPAPAPLKRAAVQLADAVHNDLIASLLASGKGGK